MKMKLISAIILGTLSVSTILAEEFSTSTPSLNQLKEIHVRFHPRYKWRGTLDLLGY